MLLLLDNAEKTILALLCLLVIFILINVSIAITRIIWRPMHYDFVTVLDKCITLNNRQSPERDTLTYTLFLDFNGVGIRRDVCEDTFMAYGKNDCIAIQYTKDAYSNIDIKNLK